MIGKIQAVHDVMNEGVFDSHCFCQKFAEMFPDFYKELQIGKDVQYVNADIALKYSSSGIGKKIIENDKDKKVSSENIRGNESECQLWEKGVLLHGVGCTIYELRKMLVNMHGKEHPYILLSTGRPAFEEDCVYIPGEVFRLDPETGADGSNFGRVRLNGKILPQEPEEGHRTKDWLQIKIPGFGKVYVYRVIAGAWCQKRTSANIVHHISNNGYDNQPSNLLWVTKTEHDAIEVGNIR